MSLLQNSNAISSGSYDINNSLRLRSSASAYLNRTPASASDQQKFTWSGWVKIGYFTIGYLQAADGNSGNRMTSWYMRGLGSTGTLEFEHFDGTTTYNLTSSAVFRDPSAWYHITVAVDTTQATSANRTKIYINGTQQTVTGTYVPQNTSLYVNGTTIQAIGSRKNVSAGYGNYFDGYMTEVNFVDGSQLTPSSFGETDTTTGSWKPKAYTGTYGTNGFYLKFSDIATTSGSNAGLGKDFSGNGNYWTTNNISITAGTTYDAMIDSPTLTSATVANYCTLNPLRNTASSLGTFSNANLKISGTSGTINCVAAGTMAFSGKMYCEMTIEVRGNNTTTQGVGIVPISSNESNRAGTMSTGIYYLVDGNKRVTGTSSAYGSSYTSGDVIGIAVDTSAETVTFYKNNVSQGSISGTGVISAQVFPYIGFEDSGSPEITANFGQRPFSYTPPTGFVALNTYNL